MEYEIKVTRKGQTTIPVKLRRKYNIVEGSRLTMVDTEQGILVKPLKGTLDLAGSGSKKASPRQMKKLLDRLREEDL
ncbi:MAG: AbrB/MazE/SpoVT family DNA-binding domain-containing protein [Thermoproteota archaeon]|nr:AbrB/MazE/SpoVT family DNA-binding domain-containing protein [Candidatus Brockarchaeota archaeon]